MIPIEEALKDYADTARDIRMLELATQGHWTSIANVRVYLASALELQDKIERFILEQGGEVPVDPEVAKDQRIERMLVLLEQARDQLYETGDPEWLRKVTEELTPVGCGG